MNGVASGKYRHPTIHLFHGVWGNLAAITVVGGVELENLAIFDSAAVIFALQRLLERSSVPAVDKITMKPCFNELKYIHLRNGKLTVTSRVAIGKDERMLPVLPFTVPLFDPIDNFHEEGDELLRMRGRASAVLTADRVCHMGLVVRGIGVLSVPARWKPHLSTKTTTTELVNSKLYAYNWNILLGALFVRKLIGFRTTAAVVVQARIVNRLLRIGLGEAAGHRITSKHAEIIRKRNKRSLLRTIALKVVNDRTTMVDRVKRAVLCANPKIRGPIVALVLRNWAGSTSRSMRLLSVHGEVKSISADDGVEVSRGNAGVNDGVGTDANQRTVTAHLQEHPNNISQPTL